MDPFSAIGAVGGLLGGLGSLFGGGEARASRRLMERQLALQEKLLSPTLENMKLFNPMFQQALSRFISQPFQDFSGAQFSQFANNQNKGYKAGMSALNAGLASRGFGGADQTAAGPYAAEYGAQRANAQTSFQKAAFGEKNQFDLSKIAALSAAINPSAAAPFAQAGLQGASSLYGMDLGNQSNWMSQIGGLASSWAQSEQLQKLMRQLQGNLWRTRALSQPGTALGGAMGAVGNMGAW